MAEPRGGWGGLTEARHNAIGRVLGHRAESSTVLVAFPGIADPEALSHTATFSHSTDYALNRIVVVLDTPAQPTTWYDWEWASSGDGTLPVRKQKEVPNYVPEEYHTERFYARYTEDKGLALHETLHESTDP